MHVSGLEDQLKKSKTHEDQYKSMSLAHEEALKDLDQTTAELKTSLEARVKKAEEENSYMQGQIQSLESKNNALILENTHAKKDAERQISELQEILSTIRHELEEARMKARSACASEQVAKEELKEQASIAAECQEKYERELMLHANDVKALAVVKEKLQEQDTKFNEVLDRANAAEEKLKGASQSWVQEKKQYITENKKLESRCADLVDQNSTLHNELDKLVTQLASTTKVSFTQPPSSTSEDVGQEEAKGTLELWEIVRFARREKEIAETKGELAHSESLRYQQRCSFLEKQLADAQKNLKEEKTQTQLDVELSAKHEEVMEKVEKLNELTQANKVLMDEKQTLEQRSKAMEAKLKKLESELQSLKENNRTLTAAKDSLLGEKSALKNEIMRWTSKTNNLMEQYKNVNPDEYKRMVEEKKLFQQQIASQKTENQRTKAQLETLRANLNATTGELATLKNEHKKVLEELENLKSQSKESSAAQNEIETLKKTLAEKTEEIKEKITTLNKVKRIARQYKSQCDEKSKELDELKKKSEETSQQAPSGEAKEGTGEGVDVSSYETKIKELTDKMNNLENQMKVQKTQDEQNKAQFKEKEDKSRKVLIQAREKIQQLTALKDRLGTENEELKKEVKAASEAKDTMSQRNKELDDRLNLLQSQYDSCVARLEKKVNDLNTKRESEAEESKKKLDEKRLENEQQFQQIQQLQKQIQQQIQQHQQKLASKATAANSSGRSLGDSPGQDNTQTLDSTSGIPSTTPVSIVPPTATIKPTSAPAANKTSSAKTASIRPMPITQGTPTPTATVLPTVTSTAQETPTTMAAVVPSRNQVTLTSTASTSATVRPITSGASTSVVSTVPSQRAPAEAQAGRMTPSADTSQPTVAVTTSNKRQRDEEEDVDRQSQAQSSEPVEKRVRTTEAEAVEGTIDELAANEGDQEEEGWEVPEMESGRETPEVVLIESGDDEDEEEDEEGMEEEEEDEEDMEEDEEDEGEDEEIEEESAAAADIDVVEVIDDDDEEEEERGEEKVSEEQDEEEDIGEEEEEEVEDVEDAEEEDKDDNEMSEAEDEQVATEDIQEPDTSQTEVPEDDDVQITQTENVPVIQQLPSVAVAQRQFDQQQQQRQQEEEPGPVGRTASIDRPRSHLAPFSFSQGQSGQGPFDEADDCTVPSTPTLFVPKRTDGFAEAISSPHIHRPFNFAPPTEGNNSGMQSLGLESSISVGGMRVDDTRVNLMDETSEDITAARASYSADTTGIQDRSEPSNQTVPERSQSRGSDSAFRQQSVESLESEGDFATDVTSMTDLPSITVTPASDTKSVEETTEQNVPDTQQEAGGPEAEVALGDDEDEGNDERGEEDEGEKEGDLEPEAVETEVDKSSDVKPSEPVAVEGASSSEAIESRASTSASSDAKDSSKGRSTVVQLKRPSTTGQEASQSGVKRVQTQGGRARRIKRFIPGRGNSRGRGRGTDGRRGGGTSH
ncbi:nucleoprotein TPR-like isoform X2 [Actinia tenebrosa]|uniref:Nucleoprotein TPR-like isoform X2 n=1 Tax=Actinia tenebrosa TaxID=6105 RepID=A0A6P8J4D5_ACTTE|nr:nucleoprotein TPR-like isoform X2 [Actinia tenebrosa]